MENISLIEAAREGEFDKVRRFVESNHKLINQADPSTGFTALHWAAYIGHYEMAAYLLRYGASSHAPDNLGRWPAELAYGTANRKLITLLERDLLRGSCPPVP